jgi:hypothetical protein
LWMYPPFEFDQTEAVEGRRKTLISEVIDLAEEPVSKNRRGLRPPSRHHSARFRQNRPREDWPNFGDLASSICVSGSVIVPECAVGGRRTEQGFASSS